MTNDKLHQRSVLGLRYGLRDEGMAAGMDHPLLIELVEFWNVALFHHAMPLKANLLVSR